jgi:tetratricopeptide (TPR) repeat protein/SAM-dependent methyltransferase
MPIDVRSLLTRASAELQGGRHESAQVLYREALAHDPGNAEATHFLGLSLCQTGRGEEGFSLMRRSVELNGAEIMYRQNLGFLLSQHGLLGEAESCLREAIALQPRAPLYNFLGTVLQRRGNYREALAAYERALSLDAGDSNVHVNLGYLRFELGDIGAAIVHYRRATELDPGNVMAHNNLGNALHAQGNAAAAEAAYRQALRLAPQFALPHHNLGMLLRAEGRPDEAVACFRTAARLAPAEPASWQLLAETLADVRFNAPDPGLEAELATCLAREDVDSMRLGAPAFSLLMAEPRFAALTRGAKEIPGERLRDWLARDALPALKSPLVAPLLENAVVPDPRFERLVAALRRELLLAWKSGRFAAASPPLELLCALAHQCYLGEYVIDEPADETAMIEELRIAIERAPAEPGTRPLVALYASYRPLATIAETASFPEAEGSDCFRRLLRRQVSEPREEACLHGEIESLTRIDDPVSRAVQAQYEENPYPRWRNAPATAGRYPLALQLRTLFPDRIKDDLPVPEQLEILIAGCGTGKHAAITARLNPAARILAVDISRASLAYAQRRARELGTGNVRFAQADLLRLGELEERFDLVESVGVLHHLRDPLVGWRVLVGLLKPRGFMKIALYSEIARQGLAAARGFIAARGFAAKTRGIRAARAAIMALPEGAPERAVLDLSLDFYTLSGCRDLLFHVQEHRFTTEGIAGALRELGLEFLGFEPEDPATLRSYRAECPDDPAATSLKNWESFEARHPDTFAGMYHFWVRKK